MSRKSSNRKVKTDNGVEKSATKTPLKELDGRQSPNASSSAPVSFPCRFCDKSFLNQAELSSHEKRKHTKEFFESDWDVPATPTAANHTADDEMLSSSQAYPCYVCDESFMKCTDLVDHIKDVHSAANTSCNEETAPEVIDMTHKKASSPPSLSSDQQLSNSAVQHDKAKTSNSVINGSKSDKGVRPRRSRRGIFGKENQDGSSEPQKHSHSVCGKVTASSLVRKQTKSAFSSSKVVKKPLERRNLSEDISRQKAVKRKRDDGSSAEKPATPPKVTKRMKADPPSPPSQNKTQCPICDRILSTAGTLRTHLSTHSGARHQCKACSKSFSRMDTLLMHFHMIHDHRPDMTCSKCNTPFDRFWKLREHVAACTASNKTPPPVPKNPKKPLIASKTPPSETPEIPNLSPKEDSIKLTIKKYSSNKFVIKNSAGAPVTPATKKEPLVRHKKLTQFDCRICFKEFCDSNSLNMHETRMHSFR